MNFEKIYIMWAVLTQREAVQIVHEISRNQNFGMYIH